MSVFRKPAAVAVVLAVVSCAKDCPEIMTGETFPVSITIGTAATETKASDPDEDLISDINLFVFSEDGRIEEFIWLSRRELTKKTEIKVSVNAVMGVKTGIACCANFGFKLSSVNSLDDLANYRYTLAYPDEYLGGLPMYASMDKIFTRDAGTARLELKRLMSKISLRMDRNGLDDGVKLTVKSVSVGNCPRSVALDGRSSVTRESDTFKTGLTKKLSDVAALNREEYYGVSEAVNLYILENMQGDLLDDTVDDSGKILTGPRAGLCSYIELKCDYQSPFAYTRAGEYLTYRFYLGESCSNFDVGRNCHYRITVQPHGTGLEDVSWRVDASGVERTD